MTSITEKLKKLEKELQQVQQVSPNIKYINNDEFEKHNFSDDGIEFERKFFLDFSKTKKNKKSDIIL
jgi:hypothetical protein